MGWPIDLTIEKIESTTLTGQRPRIIGRNARLGVHGQTVHDRVVRLHTNAGIVGWGWSRASEADAHRLLGKPLALVFDPQTGTHSSFLAFDFALWDLAGRVLEMPVHRMLGDRGMRTVPLYDGSIYIDELDPDAGRDDGVQPMLDAVQRGLDSGFRAFKVKIGRGYRWMAKRAGLDRDVAVLAAIREQVGDEITLLVDANNGYSPHEARQLMRRIGDVGFFWFEEPFPEDALESALFRQFFREGGWDTLLADGEGAERHADEFMEIVRAGGIDVVQFDMRSYSLTRWRHTVQELVELNRFAAPHNWGSHLSGFYIAQFARGCPNVSMCETDPVFMPSVVAEGYALLDGELIVPDAPGFGLELDPEAFDEAMNAKNAWSVST